MTAMLAIVFAGIIVGLQALFATFTGGSTLAVAPSTLVVAAVFQPLRRRIRRAVDHRFNRARHDAEQAVAGFAARLRDDVDIATATTDLHGTVLGAVNPSPLGLWIREARPW
jgi:CRP-like cAMP-binding protein